ncbi:MAG: hypothetical protein QXG86_03500 [Candidatus Woesearchaeota archaeon]
MALLPKFKKKIKDFIIDESGGVSKGSIIKVGLLCGALAASAKNSSGSIDVSASVYCPAPPPNYLAYDKTIHASAYDHDHGDGSHSSAHANAYNSCSGFLHSNVVEAKALPKNIKISHSHNIESKIYTNIHANSHGSA